MNIENNENESKSLMNSLELSDTLKVISAIEDLRESGKAKDLPVIIELFHHTNNPEIKTKIRLLLANLKDKESVPYLISAIKNTKYSNEVKDLVSACWENGLDYSSHVNLFVDLLIYNSFEEAFEAYTVLMNFETKILQTDIDNIIDKLENALTDCSSQKKPLITDVIDFLPSISF